eukprot:TRINITY_DN25062_c0_g1_i1.p1 TRINITY_DN25062_c0_g1~~TRINITY_DN25062_c0_g1_i1.p1  ORF type:complete len:589 (+),score=77.34 TRINITY_DN25062_c0_g1_i1:56-1768(+)
MSWQKSLFSAPIADVVRQLDTMVAELSQRADFVDLAAVLSKECGIHFDLRHFHNEPTEPVDLLVTPPCLNCSVEEESQPQPVSVPFLSGSSTPLVGSPPVSSLLEAPPSRQGSFSRDKKRVSLPSLPLSNAFTAFLCSPESSPATSPKNAPNPEPLELNPTTDPKDLPGCNLCGKKFSTLRWRKHCRCCSKVFCSKCAAFKAVIPRLGADEHRVCRICKALLEEDEKFKWSHWAQVNDYDIKCFLGQGSWGKVYEVVHKETGKSYALKVIDKARLRNEDDITAVADEKRVLQQLDHPFIVKLHTTFQTHDKLFLVMDLLSGGDCYYLMARVRFPEAAVRFYCAQIILALEYLHTTHGLIYRDLKPENLVLDRDGNMILTDFGLTVGTASDKRLVHGGTHEYWPPETHRGEVCTKAVDYWALGCLAVELATGRHPFANKQGEVSVQAVECYPPHIGPIPSPEFLSFLHRLLEKDWRTRLQSQAEAEQHPWFAGLDFQRVLRREEPLPWQPPQLSAAPAGSWANFDPEFTHRPASIIPSETDGLYFADFSWSRTSSVDHSSEPTSQDEGKDD